MPFPSIATTLLKKLALWCLAIATLASAAVAGLKEFARRASEVRGEALEIQNFQDLPSRWTFKPLANAEVMAVWYGSGPGDTPTLHSGGHCVGYALTRTAADGSFYFPAWKAPRGTAAGKGISSIYAEGFLEVKSFSVPEMPWVLAPGQHFMRRALPGETPGQRRDASPDVDGCALVLN